MRRAGSGAIGLVLAAVCVAAAPGVRAQDGSEELPKILAEGDVHMRTHSWGAAVKQFELALKLDPKSFEAHYKIGCCYEQLENEQAAAVHFEAAIKLRPDDVDCAYHLGQMLVKTGRAAEALPHLERVYAKNPETDGLRAALGRLYFETGDLNQARSFLKRAVKADRDDPELRYTYAETLFRLERYEDARDEFAVAAERCRTDAKYNNIANKVAARIQITARRIRTFGLIEANGRQFRNKAFNITVEKPAGYRWGWFFPEPLPALLVFQLSTEDAGTQIVMEAYQANVTYTIASRSVKATELKPFFDAIEHDAELRHTDLQRERPFRVLREARRQETLCYHGLRKSDQRKVDFQITVGQVDNTTFRLEIVAPEGTFKKERAEIDAILKSITFEKD